MCTIYCPTTLPHITTWNVLCVHTLYMYTWYRYKVTTCAFVWCVCQWDCVYLLSNTESWTLSQTQINCTNHEHLLCRDSIGSDVWCVKVDSRDPSVGVSGKLCRLLTNIVSIDHNSDVWCHPHIHIWSVCVWCSGCVWQAWYLHWRVSFLYSDIQEYTHSMCTCICTVYT